MHFVNSHKITANLTHATSRKDYELMKKNGIKVKDMGMDGLIYKPPGFWISINGDWERWCECEDFRTSDMNTICKVQLPDHLRFIRISTVEDANELVMFLMPDMPIYHFNGFSNHRSDLLNITHHMLECMKQGIILTPRLFWQNALDNFNGIYFENSGDLHMHTLFNAWDCDSLVVFDPRQIFLNV